MLQIASLKLTNQVVLAPMAGITDGPFRKIVREYHDGLVCAEMVSAMAFHYQSNKTHDLLYVDPVERPISMQIFGSDPAIMVEAAQAVAANGADIVDINMGCPVPKVTKNGEGASLLRDLPLAARIIKAVVSGVKIPVTVKFRLGWDSSQIVAPELARIAEDSGAAAVVVHGRTREEFYHGRADWSWISKVKAGVTIPVIGNGSADSPQAAQALLTETGCDGVMIGQGVLGRPWLLRQINTFLKVGFLEPDPSLLEKFQLMLRHLDLQIESCGAERGIKEMRKHFAWYLKGLNGAARMRDSLYYLDSLDQVRNAISQYAADLGVDLG